MESLKLLYSCFSSSFAESLICRDQTGEVSAKKRVLVGVGTVLDIMPRVAVISAIAAVVIPSVALVSMGWIPLGVMCTGSWLVSKCMFFLLKKDACTHLTQKMRDADDNTLLNMIDHQNVPPVLKAECLLIMIERNLPKEQDDTRTAYNAYTQQLFQLLSSQRKDHIQQFDGIIKQQQFDHIIERVHVLAQNEASLTPKDKVRLIMLDPEPILQKRYLLELYEKSKDLETSLSIIHEISTFQTQDKGFWLYTLKELLKTNLSQLNLANRTTIEQIIGNVIVCDLLHPQGFFFKSTPVACRLHDLGDISDVFCITQEEKVAIKNYFIQYMQKNGNYLSVIEKLAPLACGTAVHRLESDGPLMKEWFPDK